VSQHYASTFNVLLRFSNQISFIHWLNRRDDARGLIVGLTVSKTKAHIARAALEAAAFQVKEVMDAMERDLKENNMSFASSTGASTDADKGAGEGEIRFLKVDGGMTENDILMQFQADLLGFPVQRPLVSISFH
jgi:glycerol kinase